MVPVASGDLADGTCVTDPTAPQSHTQYTAGADLFAVGQHVLCGGPPLYAARDDYRMVNHAVLQTPSEIASIQAIAMDMSAAYVKAAKQVLVLAEQKIVHDRFHVMQLVSKAVDQIRRAEHRKLLLQDDHRLANTKHVWLTSQENLSDKQQGVLDRVFGLRLETGKA